MKRNLREKSYIDVINLKQGKEGRRRSITRDEVEGISILQIILPTWQLQENTIDTTKKKLARCLKGYDAKKAVIIADASLAVPLGIEDILFEVRKQEFLRHADYIFRKLPGNHILLVIGESAMINFTRQELLEILLEVKNKYREISIFCKSDKQLVDLIEFLYEEWGVVIHVLDEAGIKGYFYDTALFLAANKEMSDFSSVTFGKGYVLVDPITELSCGYKRYYNVHSGKHQGTLFSGLVYEKAGKEISYELAVNMAYQNFAMYEKFEISFIDIYELECYNRDYEPMIKEANCIDLCKHRRFKSRNAPGKTDLQ